MIRPCVPWSPTPRSLAAALVVMGAIGAGAAAHAARAPEPPPDDLQITIHGSGQVVTIDPVTGRIRTPSPRDAAALSKMFQRSTTPLPVRTLHAEGGVEVLELPEEYDEVMVVRFGPFGTPTFDCLSGHEAALEHMGSGAAFDPLALPLYELAAAKSWRDAVPLVAPARSGRAPEATPAAFEKE